MSPVLPRCGESRALRLHVVGGEHADEASKLTGEVRIVEKPEFACGRFDLGSLTKHMACGDYPHVAQPRLAGDSQRLFHHTAEGSFAKAEGFSQFSNVPSTCDNQRLQSHRAAGTLIHKPPSSVMNYDSLEFGALPPVLARVIREEIANLAR